MLKQAEEQRRALESQNKGGSQRLVDLERQLSSLEDTEMSLRAEKDELLEQAELYEDWAIGVLEHASPDESILLLKAFPHVPYELWSGSPIELAIGRGSDISCRRLVAHRKSKTMFKAVYAGYRHELDKPKLDDDGETGNAERDAAGSSAGGHASMPLATRFSARLAARRCGARGAF